jgi:hypothetical protein
MTRQDQRRLRRNADAIKHEYDLEIGTTAIYLTEGDVVLESLALQLGTAYPKLYCSMKQFILGNADFDEAQDCIHLVLLA